MLIIALAAPSAFAIDSKGAAYFGGTATAFSSAKEPIEGKLDTTRQDQLTFKSTDKKFADTTFSIPYSKVVDLDLQAI
jgi:hypothetical protein